MEQFNPNTTHLLIRHQEIALKGKNRPEFEKRLCRNIQRCIGLVGNVEKVSGRITIKIAPNISADYTKNSSIIENTITKLKGIAGVAAIAPCSVIPLDLGSITENALRWFKCDLEKQSYKTFAIRTRRVDKRFPHASVDVDTKISDEIKQFNSNLKLNLKKPEIALHIEIRNRDALIYSHQEKGAHGLPMNPSERIVCLLSGGIDSPVAVHELMRRGCSPILLHFHSKPFTSEESILKVKRLASTLRKFSPLPIEMWFVSLLEIQKTVRDFCNPRYRTIHYRRFMMKIAEELAVKQHAKAIATGEAIGQVASQTLDNLISIEEPTKLPVLRPLIALDKSQIVEKAQKIGTFEISVEPHDDACVLFAPKNPSTKAKVSTLNEEEQSLPYYQLIFEALDQAEKIIL